MTAHNLCIARPYYPANTIKLCDANSYRWTLIEMLRNFNKLFIRSISNFKEKNSQVVILLYTPYTIKYIQFNLNFKNHFSTHGLLLHEIKYTTLKLEHFLYFLSNSSFPRSNSFKMWPSLHYFNLLATKSYVCA